MSAQTLQSIPASWCWAKAEEVTAAPIIYGILQPGPIIPGGVPYVRPTEIVNDAIDLAQVRTTTTEIADRYNRSRLEAGDVLISIVGTIGKVAIVPPELVGANITQSSARLRPAPEIVTSEALAWMLRSPLLHRQYDRYRLGTGVPRLNIAHVRALQLPVAPLAEQRRVVHTIQGLAAHSRRAREALDQIPPLLERLRQSVLAAAFRGDLTAEWRKQHPDVEPASILLERIRAQRRRREEELDRGSTKGKKRNNRRDRHELSEGGDVSQLPKLPANWQWTTLGEAFEVFVGATPSRAEPTYWHGDIPWVSSGEVQFCRISSTRETITRAGLEATSTRIHPPGTVLLGMIGEGRTRGQAAILDVPACNNQNCAAIRVSAAGIPPEYVYHYLLFVYERTRRGGAGNAQQALNKSLVRTIRMPLPPLEEIQAITVLLEARLQAAARIADALSLSCRRQDALDHAILAKAFRGELVPQDPNDEPASVLLERIRAERAKAASQGTARSRGSGRTKAPSKLKAIEPAAPAAPRTGKPSSSASDAVSQVLAALKRAALHRIADTHAIELSDRRSLAAARHAIRQAGLELDAILEPLDRDELEAVCRALELPDTGRSKAALRERILQLSADVRS